MARATASVDVASTNVTSTPCAAKLEKRLLVLPKRNELETKWSPCLSRAKEQSADRGHAGPEADRGHASLHAVDLRLQGRDRRVDLAAVRVAAASALEDVGEVLDVLVAIRHRRMDGFVQRAVLDGVEAVRVHDRGRETAHGRFASGSKRGATIAHPQGLAPTTESVTRWAGDPANAVQRPPRPRPAHRRSTLQTRRSWRR